MATYAEYLKANGATDEEIKLLDTPVARKAFDAMNTRLEAEAAAKVKAEKEKSDYDTWFNSEALPAYKKMENDLNLARANDARIREFLKSAAERGTIEIPKEFNIDAPPPKKEEPPPIDSRYVTADQIKGLADQVGANLAALEDMVMEHAILFPGQRLNVSKLREEALKAGKTVVPYWEEKFHVAAAREARDKADKDAYEKKLRDEGAASERERLASQYGSPETRPLAPSVSPLAPRPASGRDKQPWEYGDKSSERVANATKKVVEMATKAS